MAINASNFEQIELAKVDTKAIEKTKGDLGDRPQEANQLITFLNRKNIYELDELGIEDKIGTIIEIKKVLTKRNLMLNLEKKCQRILAYIDRFMVKFRILREKDLPSPKVIHDKLMTDEDYVDKLNKLAQDQTSTLGVKSLPTSKVLYDNLENLFFLEHEVKHLFVNKPNFSKYIEVDEMYRKMLKLKLPEDEWWEKLTDLL